jgi:hypothetical protein
MSNTYHVSVDVVIVADSFEEAVAKYDASDFFIDGHSFDAANGDTLYDQEQYVRDCWVLNQTPDWTEIKDPDGDDYK